MLRGSEGSRVARITTAQRASCLMMHARVLAVLLLATSVISLPMEVRWGQDKERVFLTIAMDCKDTTLSPSNSTFALHCKTSLQTMAFTLREDIIPEKATCKAERGSQSCILHKKHPHMFDRLTGVEGEIKNLKADWKHFATKEEQEAMDKDHVYTRYSRVRLPSQITCRGASNCQIVALRGFCIFLLRGKQHACI
jgi:hypothetical protein